VCIRVTDNEYVALLRHVYQFCWRVAAGSGKLADPILHHEPPLLKHCTDATGTLNIKEGLAYFSLDLIYDLKG
jgi:hypothetical protein